MAKTITITVQLFDATLQGRRSLRLSGSTCKLGIVPRDMMKDTLANPKLNEMMLDKYSFYMLLSDTTVGTYAVYIGKARNDARDDSDWDLLILLNDQQLQKDTFGTYAYPFVELGWEYGTYFSPKIYTYSEWAKRKGTLFYDNVNREGVILN